MNLEKVDFGYLENQLNERLENLGKWNVDINDEDKYTLKVTLTLPPFVPAIDEESGELWYVCTRKNINLRYKVKENKYLFQSDDKELLEFLFDEYLEVEDNG